jgi:hypothetical protein
MRRAGLLQLLRRQGLPWLAWLCLLLPLAQGAAAAHELSHLARNGQVQRADEGLAAHGNLCELCLAGAALGHGAPAAAAAALPLPPAAQAGPAATASPSLPAAPAAAYQSRAPPASLR